VRKSVLFLWINVQKSLKVLGEAEKEVAGFWKSGRILFRKTRLTGRKKTRYPWKPS